MRVLVDPGYIGFDNVKRDMAMGKDRILARLADNPHRRLVDGHRGRDGMVGMLSGGQPEWRK